MLSKLPTYFAITGLLFLSIIMFIVGSVLIFNSEGALGLVAIGSGGLVSVVSGFMILWTKNNGW